MTPDEQRAQELEQQLLNGLAQDEFGRIYFTERASALLLPYVRDSARLQAIIDLELLQFLPKGYNGSHESRWDGYWVNDERDLRAAIDRAREAK